MKYMVEEKQRCCQNKFCVGRRGHRKQIELAEVNWRGREVEMRRS